MVWSFDISEEERSEFGSENRFYLLGEKKVCDILIESKYRKGNSYSYKWCNELEEQKGPYDISIINKGMKFTLDIKTACLKDAGFEWAKKNFKLLIKSRQIEKKIENLVDYYIYCILNKKMTMFHIMGWIEKEEVIKLIENREIIKDGNKDPSYGIPIYRLRHMKTLFIKKLRIDANFLKLAGGERCLDEF